MGKPSSPGGLFRFISLITFRYSCVVIEPSQLSLLSSFNVCEKCTSLIKLVIDFLQGFYLSINWNNSLQSLLVCHYYDLVFSRWPFLRNVCSCLVEFYFRVKESNECFFPLFKPLCPRSYVVSSSLLH